MINKVEERRQLVVQINQLQNTLPYITCFRGRQRQVQQIVQAKEKLQELDLHTYSVTWWCDGQQYYISELSEHQAFKVYDSIIIDHMPQIERNINNKKEIIK